MATLTKPTGNAGNMRIDDDGEQYVTFWLLGVNKYVPQIPWASISDGQVSSWQAFNLEANVAWQKVATLLVTTPQTVTFRLGASSDPTVGGPTDFAVDIQRQAVVAEGTGLVRVKVGNLYQTAIPYVNDKGVWKQAQPWGRLSGIWKPSN